MFLSCCLKMLIHSPFRCFSNFFSRLFQGFLPPFPRFPPITQVMGMWENGTIAKAGETKKKQPKIKCKSSYEPVELPSIGTCTKPCQPCVGFRTPIPEPADRWPLGGNSVQSGSLGVHGGRSSSGSELQYKDCEKAHMPGFLCALQSASQNPDSAQTGGGLFEIHLWCSQIHPLTPFRAMDLFGKLLPKRSLGEESDSIFGKLWGWLEWCFSDGLWTGIVKSLPVLLADSKGASVCCDSRKIIHRVVDTPSREVLKLDYSWGSKTRMS